MGAGAVDPSVAAASGRGGVAGTGACRGGATGGFEGGLSAPGALVRTACRFVFHDTTALADAVSGAGEGGGERAGEREGSGDCAPSGSGAVSRSNQRSRRARCAVGAAMHSTASSNPPMRRRSPSDSPRWSPGASCVPFTHKGALLLMQRTLAAWPTEVTCACWRDTPRSGSASTRSHSRERPMMRPSGGSCNAVASGSVAPGRHMTRSAITVGPFELSRGRATGRPAHGGHRRRA